MYKDTELELIKLKNQQQENINRLDGVIGEASRRYHNNDDVQISLKTLMGAIEVLKDEQKRLIDTQINLSKHMAAQVDEAIEKLNAEKIERLLYSHVSKIEQKSYNLGLAYDKKIDEIKSSRLNKPAICCGVLPSNKSLTIVISCGVKVRKVLKLGCFETMRR